MPLAEGIIEKNVCQLVSRTADPINRKGLATIIRSTAMSTLALNTTTPWTLMP